MFVTTVGVRVKTVYFRQAISCPILYLPRYDSSQWRGAQRATVRLPCSASLTAKIASVVDVIGLTSNSKPLLPLILLKS